MELRCGSVLKHFGWKQNQLQSWQPLINFIWKNVVSLTDSYHVYLTNFVLVISLKIVLIWAGC